ncbi:MAG TPA: GntR family transcriptional regulator [Gaiellaceae bacterium]|jgi:GntR family transcriptional regulator|nr:GntR family transcriptional regulator [Gaiellaceae bacterium]
MATTSALGDTDGRGFAATAPLDLALELEREAPTPLHEQISAAIRRQIVRGAWPAHMRLPAEPDLADALQVSRGTIRRSLRTLIEDSLLVQVRGRGTFVGSISIEQPIGQELLSLAEGLAREGIAFETEVQGASIGSPPAPIAALLELGESEEVFEIKRRRLIDGAPVAVLHNFVRRRFCPGIEANDFRRETMFGLLERVYGLRIASGRRTFEAQAASREIAEALDVSFGAPVLYLEQLTYLDDGQPLEYSDVWIRGDRLKLTSVLSRPAATTT